MLLTLGGTHLTTLRKFECGEAVLEHLETKECKSVSEGALLQAIFDGKIAVVDPNSAPTTLPGVALARAQERGATVKAIRHGAALLQWITALRQRRITAIRDEPWIRSEIKNLAKGELAHLPQFKITTLYQAELKLRKAQDDASVLVPNFASRGAPGHMRIDPAILQFMKDELDERLAETLPRPFSTLALFHKISARIASHNVAAERPLPPVSESSVRRFVNREVPAYLRLELRVGKKTALKRYRSNSAARDVAAYPLEISEYDDIDTAVFLIDERNGLPWGRAWLTNGVCQNTLAPLGYDLGKKPRSYESAIGAICDSLLPKTDCLPGEMGYGVQGVMLVDNASYNTSIGMRHRCETEGLLFARARPFGSTEKSVIEHFNHIVKSDFCPSLPGWRGDKGNRDAVVKGMTSAILTVKEFAKKYRHWLTKIYANMPGDDGMTSKQRWLKFYARFSPAVRYTPAQLELLRLRPVELKFRDSGGLQRLRLRYDCPALDDLRRRLGATATVVAYVPPTLSYLKVLHPFTNTFIDVPCTEDHHHYVRTTTAAQHKLILAIQRTRKKNNPSISELVEGRKILAQMVAEASKSHKLRTRRWAMQIGDPDVVKTESNDVSNDAGPAPKQRAKKEAEVLVVCTLLESQMAELESIDVDDQEDWA